jgi:hypothetical protein
MLYITSKSIKGKEFIYSMQYSILCKNKEQADKLTKHLNNNDKTASEKFKLKDNEVWFTHEVGDYEKNYIPFRLKSTKNKITLEFNI